MKTLSERESTNMSITPVLIVWLILNLVISLPLYKVIYCQISSKALVAITLVDLIYRDTIIYIYLLLLAASSALVHCLLANEPNLTLSYDLATFYSAIMLFFVCCITSSLVFSGGLRLLSLMKNSEAAGLQLLGPDDIAINKVRIISILTSLAFQIVMVFKLDAPAGVFTLLYESNEKSHFEEFEENGFKTLYLVWPASGIAINTLTICYSFKLKRSLKKTVSIFTVEMQYRSGQIHQNENFSISLNSVIGIPLMIMFAVFTSIATRKMRLLFFYPFQMTLMSVVLPISIISRNEKMKNYVFRKCLFNKTKFWFTSRKVSPA
jgi:hypothetical protein